MRAAAQFVRLCLFMFVRLCLFMLFLNEREHHTRAGLLTGRADHASIKINARRASVKDPRALTALRKSGLNPEQLMPALCHRLPVEELPSFIDEMIRSGKYMGYAWSADSQLNWFSRICYRMGAAKAIPVLEKIKTDKPDMAKTLQIIIDGLTAN